MSWKQNIKRMNRKLITILSGLLLSTYTQAQERIILDTILSTVRNTHPELKSFDAQIRALDEAAKGAKNWEPPELSTGLWMVPYNPNLWKKQSNGNTGMGQYITSPRPIFPTQ